MKHILTFENFLNEGASIKVGDTVEKSFASDEKDYTREFKVIKIDSSGKAELAEIGNDKAKTVKMYVSDLRKLSESSIEEAKKKGLWANIHAKRARGEKPAKPGDEDYPDEDAWKAAKKTSEDNTSDDDI
jgi:hypothetical protein